MEAHGKPPYTSWIRRVGALYIDRIPFVLLLYAAPVIAVAIGEAVADKSCTIDPGTGNTSCHPTGTAPLVGGIFALIFVLLALVFWIWNWGYRQGKTGSSIGKSVLTFKVVSERTGQPIGFWLSVAREIAHFFDAICYVGYLLPLFTAKRQTIADMMMSTVCLPIEPPEGPAARRSRAPWIVAGLSTVIVAAIVAVPVVLWQSHKSTTSPQLMRAFTGLNNPRAVAVDSSGAVYVADSGNNRVLKLPAAASAPTTLPFGDLNNPSGVAVDTAGAVYVTDSGHSRVLELPAGASTPTTLPFPGLRAPSGVAVDAAGAVYVVNAAATAYVDDQVNNQVLKLAPGATTPTTLPFTFSVSSSGPTGVAVDSAGAVYVAYGGVLKLAAGATQQEKLPFDVEKASFGGATGVAVDSAGAVYITDTYWQRVVKLAAGSTSQVVLPFNNLGRPLGVAVDSARNVYVTDETNEVLKLPARQNN
jgi:streptogramin lyase